MSTCMDISKRLKDSSKNNIVFNIYKPVREKTNNLDSDQVKHKPACTVTGAG